MLSKRRFIDAATGAGLLCLYFLTTLAFPDGPNRDLGVLVVPALAGLTVLLGLIGRGADPRSASGGAGRAHLLLMAGGLVLLPMTFIGQYLIANAYFLSLETSVRVFAAFLGVTICFVMLVPLLLSRRVDFRMIAGVNCLFLLIIFSMAALSYDFQWVQESAWGEKALYLAVCAGFLVLLLQHSALTVAVVCSVFFAVSLVSVGVRQPHAFTEQSSSGSSLAFERIDAELLSRPNIYVLTYDSYVSNQTLQQLGIDNTAQERYLDSLGFTRYPNTYTLDIFSAESMSLVFDPGLDPASGLSAKRKVLAGTNPVKKYFQDQGYRTESITLPYLVKDQIPVYDFMFPTVQIAAPGLLFAREILRGAFDPAFWEDLFDVAHVSRSGATGVSAFDEIKHDRLGAEVPNPRFVIVHTPSPGHAEFLGQCSADAIDDFEQRLVQANASMRKDISTILAHDRDSLIVINGDHGPSITGDCHVLRNIDRSSINRLHLQDRWGTFLAVRWPPSGQAPEEASGLRVLQDLFPVILSHLTGDTAYLKLRREAVTHDRFRLDVQIRDGVIIGGQDDGLPLFEDGQNDAGQ